VACRDFIRLERREAAGSTQVMRHVSRNSDQPAGVRVFDVFAIRLRGQALSAAGVSRVRRDQRGRRAARAMSRPCPRPLVIEPQKRLKSEAESRFRTTPLAPDNPYYRSLRGERREEAASQIVRLVYRGGWGYEDCGDRRVRQALRSHAGIVVAKPSHKINRCVH